MLGVVTKEERPGQSHEGVPGTPQPKFSVDTGASPRYPCLRRLRVREALRLSLTEDCFNWASVWHGKRRS